MSEYPLCLYRECIDCPDLATCKKDQNEFSQEEFDKYIERTFCPRCGFPLCEDVTGTVRVCFWCDHVKVLKCSTEN